MMKLWVDDIREAPDKSWTVVRTITEAIRAIGKFEFEEISLDHDISLEVLVEGTYRPFPSPETFQPVAYFLVAAYNMEKGELLKKPKVTVHSSNIPAGEEMIEILKGGDLPVEHKPMGAAFRKQ
jgi:hypothetical protein